MDPPGEAKPDREIMALVARRHQGVGADGNKELADDAPATIARPMLTSLPMRRKRQPRGDRAKPFRHDHKIQRRPYPEDVCVPGSSVDLEQRDQRHSSARQYENGRRVGTVPCSKTEN